MSRENTIIVPEHVRKKFQDMGAELCVRRGSEWELNNSGFTLDVVSDRLGERFELAVSDELPTLMVADVRPDDRHLLLVADGAPEKASDTREQPRRERFLCGHDERHWFVAAIPVSVVGVQAAKEALKPPPVLESQHRARVKAKKRNRRKNAGFKRQGEWFFVPAPDVWPEPRLIRRNEPLHRGSSKPHLVELFYSFGDSYAKGRVRHPDHKTIVLRYWHRIHLSREYASEHVAFVD